MAIQFALKADRRRTLTTGLFQILGAVAAIGMVFVGKELLHQLIDTKETSATRILLPLLALALVTALTSTMGAVRGQQERLLGEEVGQLVWNDVLDVVTNVDLLTYEQPGFATEFANVERGGLTKPLAMTKSAFEFVGSLLSVLAMLSALLAIAPILAPLLLLGGVPAILVSRRASKLEFSFVTRFTPLVLRREYIRRVLSQRENAAETRSFGSAIHLRRRHSADDLELISALTVQVRRRTHLALIQTGGSTASLLIVLISIVLLLDRNLLTLPEAGAAAIAVRILGSQLTAVYNAYAGLTDSAPFIRELERFLSRPKIAARTAEPSQLVRSLEIDRVSFKYPMRSELALDDVSIRIGAGEVVAIVGENGSGKTTLSKLVAGLYPPQQGTILWDGSELTDEQIRASVTVVFQDFGRYCFSLTDNIAVAGHGDERRPDIHAAAEAARLSETISSLPQGFDTILGRELDGALDLSGGQWQRVALARALFKNSSLIVLDEPSAALDPRAESELFEDVRSVLNGRSALLISHRYSNVRLADRIYVLEHGRVIETGTHSQLMSYEGKYSELFTLQSGAYGMDLAGE